ncbi:hypothetical protein FOMPIDRAFT_99279 [Fomitopsis schrenkii]|uniref:F-box domain-containing protein n=1 Tax=Fomitopsis schrenkii TaxID=2126942 RepID=S8FG88_FOMSC|nr:hypothetical protein FOMPIDRAFT_99279 [Fomitopsis schrenkii]
MTGMERRIPQELVDMVLYALGGSYENRETLKSCSLTCRAWLPASRTQLFESVKFDHPKDITSFSAILRKSPCLARYVRTLELLIYDPDNDISYSDEDLDSLRTIVESMDRVQCLRLVGGSYDGITFLNRLPRMDCVSEVHFYCMLFDNIGCYTRLFASLPNVEDITIETLSFSISDDELITLPVVAPKLRKVCLFDGCLGAYALLLPSALDHLTISLSTVRDLRDFCGVFHQSNAASSLTALDISDHSHFRDESSTPYKGLLRQCTALRRFRFYGSLLCAVYVMKSAPSSVTHVKLSVPQDSMKGFRCLAAALNCERLPRLGSVVLRIRRSKIPRDFDEADLPNVLPDLHARGILTIRPW